MSITIYGKPKCSECDKAKLVLQMYQVPFEYNDLTQPEHSSKLQEFVSKGIRTLPIMFNGTERIEDNNALLNLVKSYK